MTGLIHISSDDSIPAEVSVSQIPQVAADAETGSAPPLALDPWRDEVAARLARYRARRKPRAPRYPSLQLPFESETWSQPTTSTPSPATGTQPGSNLAFNDLRHGDEPERSVFSGPAFATSGQFEEDPLPFVPPAPAPFSRAEVSRAEVFRSEATAKILEFPRSAAIPIVHTSSLADPIVDLPRIVEAPELVPPPPALGGILIEPATPLPVESRAAETRLQSASVFRRLLATAVDSLMLIISLSAFAAIFLRFNPARVPVPLAAGVAAALAICLWFTYQYIFVVYTGTTLGMRAARLQIVKFDGCPVSRRLRRWRVLASLLSGFSAGLGYLWCFLDPDSLCWHDRITRTHLSVRH
ncbi:MAG: RDD family protein [Terriglobales bacterium]